MTRHRIRFLLPMAVLIVLAACDSSPTEPSQADLVVETDKDAYSLASDAGATPSLINLGPDTVYAPLNEYVWVERLVNGAWTDRTTWFVVDGSDISIPVAPGDTLRSMSMSFGYVDRTPGVYRFVFEVAYDRRGRRPIPEDQRVTAPFELTP